MFRDIVTIHDKLLETYDWQNVTGPSAKQNADSKKFIFIICRHKQT